MALTDSDYNQFASSLAWNLEKRIRGLDPSSARLVGVRPGDHILGGFLTPIQKKTRVKQETDDEEELTADLPTDSSYEQTSIGAEWLAPSITHSGNIQFTIGGAVYVRRVPRYNEQKQWGIWRTRKLADKSIVRFADLIPVWTRESWQPITTSIPIDKIVCNGKVEKDLTPDIRLCLNKLDEAELFPGRRPIEIEPLHINDTDSYSSFVSHLPTGEVPLDWRLILDIRAVPYATDPSRLRIVARIINKTESVARGSRDYVDPNIYTVSFEAAIPIEAHRSSVFHELPSSFRYDREMPGIGINGHVESEEREQTINLRVATVPMKSVPRLEPRDISGAEPTFKALMEDPIPILRKIHEAMHEYNTTEWSNKLSQLSGQEYKDGEDARNQFLNEIARFHEGIKALEDDRFPSILWAFKLMNRVMERTSTKFKTWRLFQIVFIVSQIRELASREHEELCSNDDGRVEVLWFAAGGGKTEAFLGLIVWQAFFDRIRGKANGVSAFLRFPLRLLTFQQLQRLSLVLAQAERIRGEENLQGARFSIGYFVGSSVTPNKIEDDAHRRFQHQGVDPKWQRIFSCPFCRAPVTLRYAASIRLVEHQCTSSSCPGGHDRLPIFIIDDDIYRFLPTVIVSTVDKLALLGQNQRFANLFGRIDAICSVHGATFQGTNRMCQGAKSIGSGQHPTHCGDAKLDYGPFHDPSPALLVQDELHLLSEELGTFDSHYETGVMQVTKALGSKPWKIITATATIEAYQKHAHHLYLKSARQFPGPGPEAYDSFYYRQNQSRLGRIFVGILGVGRKHTPSVTRALTLFYLEVQAARDLARTDLALAGTTYIGRAVSADEFRWLVFLYELALTYVLTRKGSDQVSEAIESRVKKEVLDVAPDHGELLVETFNGGVDVTEMIGSMERIASLDDKGEPHLRTRGLVATNIIGHGVDVDRFNVMVFAGFTRLVAEYIQASARVGRTFPGISIFVVTPQSERDRSIFDRFGKFHEYLDRLVDPSAVNRWPEPAVGRTLPGLLCGYLMGVAASKVGKQLASVESVQECLGRSGAEALTEDAVVSWLMDAYGTKYVTKYGARVALRAKNEYSLVVNTPPSKGKPKYLNRHLGAMRSLRDVDDPAYIEVNAEKDAKVINTFTNV